VVDERTHVGQADHLDLAMADLGEDGRVLRLSGARNRKQRLLVIHVERADGEPLLACALHELSRVSHVALHLPVPFAQECMRCSLPGLPGARRGQHFVGGVQLRSAAHRPRGPRPTLHTLQTAVAIAWTIFWVYWLASAVGVKEG